MKYLICTFVVSFGLTAATSCQQESGSFPKNDNTSGVIYGSDAAVTLQGNSSSHSSIVLDYGANVEGFPTFEVVSVSGDVSGFQIRYSETKAILDSNPQVG